MIKWINGVRNKCMSYTAVMWSIVIQHLHILFIPQKEPVSLVFYRWRNWDSFTQGQHKARFMSRFSDSCWSSHLSTAAWMKELLCSFSDYSTFTWSPLNSQEGPTITYGSCLDAEKNVCESAVSILQEKHVFLS